MRKKQKINRKKKQEMMKKICKGFSISFKCASDSKKFRAQAEGDEEGEDEEGEEKNPTAHKRWK